MLVLFLSRVLGLEQKTEPVALISITKEAGVGAEAADGACVGHNTSEAKLIPHQPHSNPSSPPLSQTPPVTETPPAPAECTGDSANKPPHSVPLCVHSSNAIIILLCKASLHVDTYIHSLQLLLFTFQKNCQKCYNMLKFVLVKYYQIKIFVW